MLRAVAPIVGCFGMLAVVACGGRDPVAMQANNTAGLPSSSEQAPDPSGAPPENGAAPAPAEPAAATSAIPAALQGRWALAPLDCTSTRGDAKGLLIVSADRLQFYESVAVPGANVTADADSISGEFRFTGEGQTWTKFQALSLQGGQLVRTESNPTASFTYARCK